MTYDYNTLEFYKVIEAVKSYTKTEYAKSKIDDLDIDDEEEEEQIDVEEELDIDMMKGLALWYQVREANKVKREWFY